MTGSGAQYCDDAESCSNLEFSGYSCTSTQGGGSGGGQSGGETLPCPTSFQTPNGVTYDTQTQSDGTCTYTAKCMNGQSLVTKDNASNTVTCALGAKTGATKPCSSEYLEYQFQNYQCVTPVTCGTMTITNGQVAKNNTSNPGLCSYTITCNNGYSTGQTDNTFTCTDVSDCNTAINNYTCSSVCSTDGINNWDDNGSVTQTQNSTQCVYSLSCDDDYQISDANQSTLKCNFDNCTAQWLSSTLNSVNCVSAEPDCPDVPQTSTGSHGTFNKRTNNGQCVYSWNCNSSYANPDEDYQDLTCTVDQCANLLNNWASGLSCKNEITCPSTVNLTHGTVTWTSTKNGTACKANVNCHGPSYTCDTAYAGANYCENKECDTTSACDSLRTAYFGTYKDICSNFGCLSASDMATHLGISHVVMSLNDLGSEQCKYTASDCSGDCWIRNPNGQYGQYGLYAVTCTGEQCNGTTWAGTANDPGLVGYCVWDSACGLNPESDK